MPPAGKPIAPRARNVAVPPSAGGVTARPPAARDVRPGVARSRADERAPARDEYVQKLCPDGGTQPLACEPTQRPAAVLCELACGRDGARGVAGLLREMRAADARAPQAAKASRAERPAHATLGIVATVALGGAVFAGMSALVVACVARTAASSLFASRRPRTAARGADDALGTPQRAELPPANKGKRTRARVNADPVDAARKAVRKAEGD